MCCVTIWVKSAMHLNMIGNIYSESMDNAYKQNVSRPKKKFHPGFFQNLFNYFCQYSDNSSIHGIKYIGERKRSIVEKLWWLSVFTVSLYFSISMIFKIYQKWQNTPVIVSLARSPTPIWKIPFPAVTICSEIKTRRSIFNFTRTYNRVQKNENLTEEEESMMNMGSLVCDNHLYQKGSVTVNHDTIDFLAQVAPPFDQFFYQCKWMNEKVNCSNLFTPILTEEGICYTFNTLNREELFKKSVFSYRKYLDHNNYVTNWTLESGYPKSADKNSYPRRAISAGQVGGLSLLVQAHENDLDYICKGPVQGFKILLHHPAEVPRMSQQYFRAPLNQLVVVSIKPDMMTTSAGLRNYLPSKRQCYFAFERQLSFYKVYTQQNCEVECLTNFTLQTCDCVSYYMPHAKKTLLCRSKKRACVLKAQRTINLYKITSGDENTHKNFHETCDCLPACTSLAYNSESSQAHFNWPKAFQASEKEFPDLAGAKLSGIILFFKEMQFITSEKNELYGPIDFLASCGGLLALFMGFSFLSIIEILYFLSLRLICNVQNYGYRFWSGTDEATEND